MGGTFQGVGMKEWFLIVTEAQYKALMEAKVIAPEDSTKRPKVARIRASTKDTDLG